MGGEDHRVLLHFRARPCRPAVPNLFGTRDRFCGRQFFHGRGWVVVSGWFKCITFIVHFISITVSYIVIYNEIIIQFTIMLTGGRAQGVI